MKRSDDNPLIGVDLGGTKILACVVTPSGRVLSSAKKKTKAEKGLLTVLDRIDRTVREALGAARIPMSRVQGIGVAVPGAVEAASGVVRIAPNLGWRDIPVRKLLSQRLLPSFFM